MAKVKFFLYIFRVIWIQINIPAKFSPLLIKTLIKALPGAKHFILCRNLSIVKVKMFPLNRVNFRVIEGTIFALFNVNGPRTTNYVLRKIYDNLSA